MMLDKIGATSYVPVRQAEAERPWVMGAGLLAIALVVVALQSQGL